MESQKEKFKKLWIDTQIDRAKGQMQANFALESASLSATIDLGKSAVHGAFLLNGSAAVAILYNAHRLGEQWISLLQICALGALLAVSAAGLSYICQRLYTIGLCATNNDMIKHHFNCIYDVISYGEIRTQIVFKKNYYYLFGHIFSVLACILVVLSLICFAYLLFFSLSQDLIKPFYI